MEDVLVGAGVVQVHGTEIDELKSMYSISRK